MNTEIDGETYFELISAGKNKSFRIATKAPIAQPRFKDKMDLKKNNLSYSYKTYNSSANPIYSIRSNYPSNNLEEILETTPEIQENDENIGNQYQKSSHVNVYQPKKVKINESANSKIYFKETNEQNLNDSIDGKNFEFFDPRRERSPNGIGNLQKYVTKTTVVMSNGNSNNMNTEVVNGASKMGINGKRLPIFSNKYMSIKKLLEESQISKRLITEIEDSRVYDFKKSKNNRSNQNLKTASNTVVSNINLNNYSSNKSYNEDNQLDKSRDMNTHKRILIRYGDNIHTIIKIQKIWRGFKFRFKLYLTLTRYYKGRAFVSHFNVIKRNLFKLFKRLLEIDIFSKPVRILKRILNKGKKEALKSIMHHSSMFIRQRESNEKIISFMKTFRTVFTRTFYSFVLNVLRHKIFVGIFRNLENNSAKNSIAEEYRHSEETKFSNLEIQSQDLHISHYNQHVYAKTDCDDQIVDLVLNKLKILRKFLNNKMRVDSSNKFKHLQIWKIRNSNETLNELLREKENLKKYENVVAKAFSLEISQKINEVNIVNQNKKGNLIIYYKYNRIVLRRIKEDEAILRRLFRKWLNSYSKSQIKQNLTAITYLHNYIHNSVTLEIISENTQNSKNLGCHKKFNGNLDNFSQEIEADFESVRHIGKMPKNYQAFEVYESHLIKSEPKTKLLKSQAKINQLVDVCESHEIQTENNSNKLEINPTSNNDQIEFSEISNHSSYSEKSKNRNNISFQTIEICLSHEIKSDFIPKNLNLKDPTKNHLIQVSESHEIKFELQEKNKVRKPNNYHIIEVCDSHEVLQYSTPIIQHKKENTRNHIVEVCESHEIKCKENSEILQKLPKKNDLIEVSESHEILSTGSPKKNSKNNFVNLIEEVCGSHEIVSDLNQYPQCKKEPANSGSIEISESLEIKSKPQPIKNFIKPKNNHMLKVCEYHEIISDSLPFKNKNEPAINHKVEVCESHEIKSFLSPAKLLREFTGSNIIESSLEYEITSQSPRFKSAQSAERNVNIVEVIESHEILKDLNSCQKSKALSFTHSIEVSEMYEVISDKTTRDNIFKIFNRNSQLIDVSNSLQIKSSYEKPSKKEPSNLQSIEVTESIEIKSPEKEIKTFNSIENSSRFEITSDKKNSDLQSSSSFLNTKAVKKIEKIIKKDKKPSIELNPNRISLSSQKEIYPVILAKSFIHPQLISQNIINYNITLSSEKNHAMSNKNLKTEIRKGVKLILLGQKQNLKNLRNKLIKLFSVWKAICKTFKLRSTKRNYLKSITNNMEPVKTKAITTKREEQKIPRKLNITNVNHMKFMIHLVKITTRNSFKILSKHFNNLRKKTSILKDTKSLGISNLGKIIKNSDKLTKKLILIRFLSLWKSKFSQLRTSSNNSDFNLEHLNIPILSRIRQKFLLRLLKNMNLKLIDKSFMKWKILSSNLKKNLILTIASTQLVRKLNKIFLKKTLPKLIINSKLKSLQIKRTNLLKSILNNSKNRVKVIMKKRMSRWIKLALPFVEKKDLVKIINSFTKMCHNLKNIINHCIYKNFLKTLKKSADWKNPKIQQRSLKIVTYYLKNGQTVKIKRDNFNQNFIWKYVQPLKYYFICLKIKSVKLREIQLRSISNKWSIEKNKSVLAVAQL